MILGQYHNNANITGNEDSNFHGGLNIIQLAFRANIRLSFMNESFLVFRAQNLSKLSAIVILER